MTAETLSARLRSRDAARFVGRTRELTRLEALLNHDPPANVVILHGPAGVGKSALLRELARRGLARGWTPFLIEARELTPLADALDEAFARPLNAPRPLVLLDSWERLTALDAHLRGDLLPELPPDALVVMATRRPPASGWFRGGWEHVVLDLSLEPLYPAEADALLAARGIDDESIRAAATAWARGSPLALVLAADAGGVPAVTAADDAPPGVVDKLLPRLLDTQPEGEQRSVLAVAALAHATTPALLAAALPDIDAERAFAWLRGHPSAEPSRDGVMLHDLVGRVLRADIRRRSPELERDIRRRLVDALYADAIRGGLLQLTRDLQHLVQDPAIRWGFSWDTSGRYRIDSPHVTDTEAIGAKSGRAALVWLERAKRYFAEAPARVTIVRDQDDVIAGYGIAVTSANAPSFADSDPVLAPRLRHAADHVPSAAAVIWRQAVDLTHERSSPVIALIGMAGVIGSGLANPAAAYLPIARDDAAGQAFSAACGATPVPELAVEDAGVCVECHVIDYGPGGLLNFQRSAVYRELGLAAPLPAPITLESVREALKHYGSPALLAAGPLAPSHGSLAARADSARARIDAAMRDAFGRSKKDQELRRVLVRGYLDPAETHEIAAAELNLSRPTYFRRLRAAVDRLATQLGAPASRD